jgi:hypothetical protein
MHFVGMSALTITDPDGEVLTIRYRLDLTMVSLIVVIVLCYVGIFLSSRDGVYTSDNEDRVDEFIRDAANMTISELKAMRHKNYVLFITLFKKMEGILAGGTITAAGVCVMHYIGELHEHAGRKDKLNSQTFKVAPAPNKLVGCIDSVPSYFGICHMLLKLVGYINSMSSYVGTYHMLLSQIRHGIDDYPEWQHVLECRDCGCLCSDCCRRCDGGLLDSISSPGAVS